MTKEINIKPKIVSSSELESLKVVHTNFEIKDPITVEKYIDGDNIQILVFSSINYEYFSFLPLGKKLEIKIGGTIIWESNIDRYIIVNTIKREKKDDFIVISGLLYDFDEKLL